MPQRHALDVILIGSPCEKPWDQMHGDDRKRFCDHCGKFVHNLSAMPADEAEKVICASAGELCIRFARDNHTGQLLTLDYRPPPRVSRGRALAVVASIMTSCSVAATWVAYKVFHKPPMQQQIRVTMGEMAMPRPSQPTSIPCSPASE